MASVSQGAISRPFHAVTGRGGLVDRYFYFFMSLLIAVIVVWGFSHTVNDALFHPAIPRPLLLWIHAAVFSAWVAFYILQSVLVRSRNVRWHRRLGWFGAGLAAVMVPLGFAIAVIMGRFDKHVLRMTDADQFLSVPFGDMFVFGICVSLAIAWRRKPDLHRRLLFIATCALLDAPFDRFDYIFDHDLGFVCLDGIILLGVGRDLLVDRRVHKVYMAAMPPFVVFQAILIYLYRAAPGWWLGIGQSILG
jgi:hypothetical protein